ncbi:SRPBCC family protein [Oryzihumus sp.]|uniref:SRPBCC family protein n=1 Tax=Oryzihumus sp. TaxID=1968903 RepID=UPI002ED84D32
MQLQHRFTVPAPVGTTWATFNDLERTASCFPGAEVTSVEGEGFTGNCKVKLGPISLQYNGTGRFVERDESGHRAVIEAKGKDRRGNGTASATVTLQLSEAGEGVTEAVVDTDLSITGKPAQFGRSVMQDVSDKLLAQFVDCLQAELSAPTQAAVAEAPAATGAAPAAAPPAAVAEGGAVAGAPPAPAPAPAPAAAPSPPSHRPPAELDLGTTVLPVLLRRYAPYLAGALVLAGGAILLRRLLRRR